MNIIEELEQLQRFTRHGIEGENGAFILADDLRAIIEEYKKQEPFGYIDEYGNFEPILQTWMEEEPNVNWTPLFTHPPLSDETVKDGYVMVPSEPTKEMLVAGFRAWNACEVRGKDSFQDWNDAYKAMIGEAMKAAK